MDPKTITFTSIGTIHSPHKELAQIPIQPVFCRDMTGSVVVDAEYAEGLRELEGFSHIFLFYHFHLSHQTRLQLQPYLSDQECGIFATRAPHRPNKLGMSLVRLVDISSNILHVKDLDIADGTPLLDIKPYIRRFDSCDEVRSGWQDQIAKDVAAQRGLRDYRK